MSQDEIEVFFAQYFGRMTKDLGREMDYQRRNPEAIAANVLVALGLVSYTEVLGRLVLWNPTVRTEKRLCTVRGRGELEAREIRGRARSRWRREAVGLAEWSERKVRWDRFPYAGVVVGVNIDRNDGAYPRPHRKDQVVLVDDADAEWPSEREGRVKWV